MSGASYFKRQLLIDDFRAFVTQYQNAVNREQLAGQALEKLASLDNLQLQGNAVHRESLHSSLLNLAGYVPNSDASVSEKLTLLLLKYPLDREKTALCRVWQQQRATILENILRTQRWIVPFSPYGNSAETNLYVALKFEHLDWLESFLTNLDEMYSSASSSFLDPILFDRDPELRQKARLFFKRLSSESRQFRLKYLARCITSYDADKIQFLIEQEYFPTEPPKVSIMVALARRKTWKPADESYATIQTLVELSAVPDLAGRAAAVLRDLHTKEGQSNLCDLFLVEESNQAGKLAVEFGYEPLNPAHKPLFFFLSQQFVKYDNFDFDRSMLRTFYEVAPPEVRRRIAQAVKQSGNPAYLDILSLKQASSEVEISSNQTKVIVQVLRDTANWAVLWQKVVELPFTGSVAALGKLLKSDWQPPTAEGQLLYQKLAGLLRSTISNPTQLRSGLPPALPYARLEVPPKINSFVFTPDSQHVLIAPNDWERPQLLDWNFRQDKQDVKTLSGFESPLHLLKFAPNEMFFCAGQPIKNPAGSLVYAWERWDDLASVRQLNRQRGIVKVLEVLPDNQLLVVREGRHPQVLNLATREIEYILDVRKIRHAVFIPAENVLTLYGGKYFHPFPLPWFSKYRKWASLSSALLESFLYVPSLQKLFMGNSAGVVYAAKTDRLTRWKAPIYYSFGSSKEYPRIVCGLGVLPNHKLIVMGVTDGQVVFRDFSRQNWLLRFRSPGGQLKGLQISPDERFMAIAESDTVLSLWDLQLLDAPKLLEQPLLHVTLQDMELLKLLEENCILAPQPVQNSLAYVRAVFDYRFRYDIEIEAVHQVEPTKFDIEL